jgi:Ca-activated chloride channel family protein
MSIHARRLRRFCRHFRPRPFIAASLAAVALLAASGIGAGASPIAIAGGGDPTKPTSRRPLHPAAVLSLAATSASHNTVYMAASPRDNVADPDARSLAPYFFVAGGDPATERLPVRGTSAEVRVAGPIAAVTLKQTFVNTGTKPIEAVYVFPASTRAAVHAMRMAIGARVVEAHIDRRQAAREIYETARREGRRASLLEQERTNVFTTSVANIMPGDTIDVTLDYSELLVPSDAIYELVVPGVVGPRYTGGADPAKDGWMANPTLSAGQAAPFPFDVNVHLETGVPIQDIASPSHKIAIDNTAPGMANVRLGEKGGAGRDYVLRYRLAGGHIQGGAVLWPGAATRDGNREGFFAVMMQPPQRPALDSIPPREYIFLLDVSGSMNGFPLDTAKELMGNLLGQLRPTDRFDVALFSGASAVMSPAGTLPATAANIRRAIDLVSRQSGGGGTELMGGLQAAYAIPRAAGAGVSRTVVVVTDGFVGVEAQAFKFIRDRMDEANLFAFGIGSSVNRTLIEGMARAGGGEPFVVLRPEQARQTAERLKKMIERPVLTRVRVAFKGLDVYDVTPEKIPDLLAERPVVVFGKYRGPATGSIELSGRAGSGVTFRQALDVRQTDARVENSALRELWARQWVAALDDQRHLSPNPALDENITELGLGYQLLTSFTSFVAVDSQIANRVGDPTSVRQPLPMPDGVSDLAIERPAALGSIGYGYGVGKGSVGGSLQGLSAKRAYKASAPPSPLLREPEAQAPAPRAPATVDKKLARSKDTSGPSHRDAAGSSDDKSAKSHPVVLARQIRIVAAVSFDITDEATLRKAIEQAFAKAAATCKLPAGTKAEIRISVDATGRVISTETRSGSRELGRCIASVTPGIQTAAHASGAKPGTFTITVEVVEIGL